MNFIKPGSLTLLGFALLILIFAGIANAELIQLTDRQMNEVTASGFSHFKIDNQVASADFDVQAKTFMEMNSMKMGYWDNGGGPGWDQDWTGVDMGSEAQDLVLKGFFFEAEFDNIEQASSRSLKSLRLGFRDVSGTITADFQSLSRTGQSARQNEGAQTYEFDGDKLVFNINVDGSEKGIWVDFGAAQQQ